MSAAISAREGGFEAGLGFSLTNMTWGEERGLRDNEMSYLSAGYHATEKWTVELYQASGSAVQFDTDARLDVKQIGIKGLYHLTDRRHSGVSPYVLMGMAELSLDDNATSDVFNKTGQILGSGVEFNFSENVRLRVEANFHRFYETHDNDAVFWVGLNVGLGGSH